MEQLVGHVLAAGGSMPGPDGQPYEAFHWGAVFIAWLLGQAFHAARRSGAQLRQVLGPCVDLLVWIPKAVDDGTANGRRPLQLPRCFIRLFGAALAGIWAPLMEPRLTPDQAAVRGGSCGRNVQRLFRHLERPRVFPPTTGPDWELWDAILGPLGPPPCAAFSSLSRRASFATTLPARWPTRSRPLR